GYPLELHRRMADRHRKPQPYPCRERSTRCRRGTGSQQRDPQGASQKRTLALRGDCLRGKKRMRSACNYSPPGPELDSQVANEPAHDQIHGTLLAALNFCVAGHFRFEQTGWIVEPRGHEHGPLRLPVGWFGNDGRDGSDLSLEGGVGIGPRLEHDSIAEM